MSFKINTAVTGFTFGLVALADGTPVTTGTTTGFVTLNGGTQAAIAGAFTHEGNGQWSVNLTAAEMNGAIVGLVFANTLAISVNFTIRTVVQLNSEQNDFDPAADTVATVSSVSNTVNLPAAPTNFLTAASIATSAMNGKGDWNIGKTGYTLTQSFPTNFASMTISGAGAVDSLVQGYLNTIMTEVTAGRIAGNFGVFYRNADALTGQTVDDVGGGGGGGTDWTASERNEMRGRLGITGTTASGGNTPTLALEATVNTRMAEASINTTAGAVDLVTANTDMRGTDSANTVIPDPAGFLPTSVDNRLEMDANSVDLNQIVSDVAGLAGAAMRGTDGANTVVPDNATIALIRTDTLTAIPALLNDIAITRNQAGVLHIQMVLTTDGRTPGIGLTVTGQRLIDSGTYVNITGVITEVSNGAYRVAYTAADVNGDMVTFKFSAATADDSTVTFLTVA